MGAVAVSDEIYQQITASAPEDGIEFFHGYTYSAHPLACAAGIATQRILREEGVFEQSAKLAPYFLERIFDLREIPLIRDIRGYGLLAGLDLAPAESFGQRGYAALQGLFAAGLLVRATGDCVILAPALIAEREHIDRICDTLRGVLSDL
jgi:beta-alanine--pyruvate transaminase